MQSTGKFKRILLKTSLFFVLFFFALLILLVVVTRSSSFQTWAAHKATNFLSQELGTTVSIERISISFIKNITLENVFIGDKHQDTLLYGKSITVDVSHFSYNEKTLNLDQAVLNSVKVKLLKHEHERDFNFQFLVDYFSPSQKTKKDTSSNWKISYGKLLLNQVDFTYRIMDDTTKSFQNMNYRNIQVKDIFGSISDIAFNGDTIFGYVSDLRAKEKCGISLLTLTTRAKISPVELRCDDIYLKTSNSFVKGNFQFKYDKWDDYTDFINKVYIKGNLKDSTYVNMKDISYFAEQINGFSEIFNVSGKVQGFVNDLTGTDLYAAYGKHTKFKGDFSISGLPDINQSYIHFDADELSTSRGDLEKFPLPPFDNPSNMKLPSQLDKLGIIHYKGKFDGFIDNFATYGKFTTDIGSLKTDLQLVNVTNPKLVKYSGLISSTNFNVAKLFSNTAVVGPISVNAKVKGTGFESKYIDATFNGSIQSITYNRYQYHNIIIDGHYKNKVFEGDLISKDVNADFDFNGTIDFNNNVPKMDFISTVNHLDLNKTNFSTSKINGIISSQLLINLNGDNLDNLSGQVNFDNTILSNMGKEYKLSTLNIDLDQINVNKKIVLSSNIANIQLQGKYKLSTLFPAFKQYLYAYFPTFINANSNYIYSDKADLKIKIKNFNIVKELFINDLMISPNTTLEGSFDASISYLYLKTNSNLIQYSGIKLKDNIININSLVRGISFNYKANSVNLTDSFSLKNPSINIVSNDKSSVFEVNWDNFIKPQHAGKIEGKALFENYIAKVSLVKSNFTVADSIWSLVKANTLTIDTAFVVKINPITFYNQNQLITLEGIMSKKSTDKFDVFIQNFKLAQFNDLLKDAQVNLGGTITGNASVFGLFDKQIINSDFNFNDLMLNKKMIGNGEINSEYNSEKDYVSIDGFTAFAKDFDGNLMKNILFQGYYFPKKTEDNLDITFKTEPLDISLLQPYLKDILTIKVGYLNGNGKITGTPSHPLINANLKFMKCVMVVDFSNVQYSVSGEVNVTPKQINFENIELRDKFGNLGIVYGNIFHDNFKNMRIDFDINTKKLMALNTTAANNPSYYGTAYVSGNAGIYGFLDDIKMEVNMKTNKGTYFYIPLDGPSEVNNNDFIRFVTKDTIKQVVKTTASNFSLDFNLEATPDAEVQLIFDEKSGDVIKARGAGSLNMTINSKGKFDMFGDYVLTTGDYLFTLENFVTKKFEIQKGSSIKWNGNVYKANIDITAIYRQKASIRPIFPSDSSGKRYPVDCKLIMKDKLTQPNISFQIDLPTIDENTRSVIKSTLSDETELNRQVFSLLLLRSFITPISAAGGSGISAGGAAAATGSEMLSNKLSHWLNGVTKDMDVGINYRPGTGLSNDQLDLTLNKQLFNNRLVLDGNFGVNNSSTKNTNSSNVIGDVSLEYKLSESGKYRVKGFNRSNDNTQIINSGGPFTQGVGIFYREEFENLSELYRRYLAKLQSKKNVN